MGERIKFNVIIPTRERASTLYHCLQTIVAQDYDDLTIIVSDNFSQDNTREVVASFSDTRIRYVNTGERISMSHNWEFALSQVVDGWIMFLGDDDGMLPGGLERVERVIKETKCQAVTSRLCHYSWPGTTLLENQLRIPIATGTEIRDGLAWLTKLMRGDGNYTDLPYLYTGGFADMALVKLARDSNGKFFLSMTPDVYSAVALASICGKYAMMKEAVCVAGVSSHSTGASSFGLSEIGDPARQFYGEKNIPFHSKLDSAKVRSWPIIVYECYLQATHLHKDMLRVDMAKQLALAMSLAKPDQYAELRNYCDKVARRNVIDLGYKRKERWLKWLKWYRRFQIVRKHWQQIVVDARDFHVKDVNGAALLSSTIVVFIKSHRNWRWRNLLFLIRWIRAI